MPEMRGVLSEQFQIFDAVVLFVRVPMVNNLRFEKQPAKVRFHHEAMLQHVAAMGSIRMLRPEQVDIPILVNHPTAAPFRVSRAREVRRELSRASMPPQIVANPMPGCADSTPDLTQGRARFLHFKNKVVIPLAG